MILFRCERGILHGVSEISWPTTTAWAQMRSKHPAAVFAAKPTWWGVETETLVSPTISACAQIRCKQRKPSEPKVAPLVAEGVTVGVTCAAGICFGEGAAILSCCCDPFIAQCNSILLFMCWRCIASSMEGEGTIGALISLVSVAVGV